jgi:hypothetical protein
VVSQFIEVPETLTLGHYYSYCSIFEETLGRCILFRKNGHIKVESFTDVDWAGSPTNRRSTTGYCTFLGGNLVTWKSKKQNAMAQSIENN